MKIDIDIDYFLRIVDITSAEMEMLKPVMPADAKCLVRPYFKNKDNFVLSFSIAEKANYSELIKYVDENLPGIKYDIFISMLLDHDTAIIDLPCYLVNLIKESNAKVVFSYTYVDGDDE
jgi:hypothetical protein